MDIIAHEYGWTLDYVLSSLSKKEVFLMVSAISERYYKQNEAYEKSKSGSDGTKTNSLSAMSPVEYAQAGFTVK